MCLFLGLTGREPAIWTIFLNSGSEPDAGISKFSPDGENFKNLVFKQNYVLNRNYGIL